MAAPNAPQPLLPPEHTAQAYAHEQVVLRPSQRPGYVEIVRLPDQVVRAILKCKGEGP